LNSGDLIFLGVDPHGDLMVRPYGRIPIVQSFDHCMQTRSALT
jgi:hypothetical protein